MTSARATATRWPWPPETSPGPLALQVVDLQAFHPAERRPLGFLAGGAVQPERQGDVLHAGQFRHQLPELEYEAELGAA